MSLKNLISRMVLPTFEADLSKALSKQMRGMEDLSKAMSPQVYSFEPVLSRSGVSGMTTGGAFGRSGAMMEQAKVVRVNRHFENKGMFHE
jgi:hypothetical protein